MGTSGQHPGPERRRQRLAMGGAGDPGETPTGDHQPGKTFAEPGSGAAAEAGRRAVHQSINRLARNYREILEQWLTSAQKRGGGYRGAGHAPAGTRRGKDLMGDLSQRHCPQVLSPSWRRTSGPPSTSARRRHRGGQGPGVRFAARPGPCRRIFSPCTGPGVAKN